MKGIKDFDIWYKKVNKSDDEIEYLEFVWELMKTPFTEYHYSLMVIKTQIMNSMIFYGVDLMNMKMQKYFY